MKLALLGTGMIVTEVLPVLTTIEGIELEAIMSTPRSLDKAETLAKQYGLTQGQVIMQRSCPIRMLTPFILEHLIIPTMTMPSKHF